MPLKAFSIYKYIGTLRSNGRTLATAGEFTKTLKQKLYQGEGSLNLDQSTGGITYIKFKS